MTIEHHALNEQPARKNKRRKHYKSGAHLSASLSMDGFAYQGRAASPSSP